MKITTVNYNQKQQNIKFKGVIPLIGEKGSLAVLERSVKKELGKKDVPLYCIRNFTSIYERQAAFSGDVLSKSAKDGKEVGLLLTGNHAVFSDTGNPAVYIDHRPIELNAPNSLTYIVELIKSKF